MSNIQKIIKVIAICFAIFIITFIAKIILFSGSFISGFDNTDHKISSYSKTFENIDNISVDLVTSELVVKEGEEFKVEVEGISKYITIDNHNGNLKIEEYKKWDFSKTKSSNIILYIPKDNLLNELVIDSAVGMIKMKNIFVKDLVIKQGVGIVEIKDSEFNKTNIYGGVGKIKIADSKLNDLNLEAGVGDINIKANITGNSHIESGIGGTNLILDNEENYQFHISKGIGNISINNKHQSNDTIYGNGSSKLKIEGGIGKINITFKK